MTDARTVVLPAPARPRPPPTTTVWLRGRRPARSRTTPPARPRFDVRRPRRCQLLAAAGDTLAATREAGSSSGSDRGPAMWSARRPLGGDADRRGRRRRGLGPSTASPERAWRLSARRASVSRFRCRGVDAVAADGDRIWWTSRDDTMLRGGEPPGRPGRRARTSAAALAVCAGSIWMSVTGGAAQGRRLGRRARAADDRAGRARCRCSRARGGILVGGSGSAGLFVLDPRLDADVRQLDVDLGGELGTLVATRAMAWVFPARHSRGTARPGARSLRLERRARCDADELRPGPGRERPSTASLPSRSTSSTSPRR